MPTELSAGNLYSLTFPITINTDFAGEYGFKIRFKIAIQMNRNTCFNKYLLLSKTHDWENLFDLYI